MLVSPDAMLLKDTDCYAFQEQMIAQGGDPKMRDRIAILDIHGGFQEDHKGGYKDEVEKDDKDKFPNLFGLEGKLIDKLKEIIDAETDQRFISYNQVYRTTQVVRNFLSITIKAE